MSYTVQQVLDIARIPLNDSTKERYSDPTLLSYYNFAVLTARRKRPDLFVGQWGDLPSKQTVGSLFPIDESYVPLFADYVTGRAELVDDEHVDNSRAVALINTFISGLSS